MKKTDKDLLKILGTEPAYLGGVDLPRLFANASGTDLARLKEIQDRIPLLSKPYTAILAAISQEGCKLEMDKWHACETTHCLAGWTVTLAGKAGARFEAKVGTQNAAALILWKSRPKAPLPNFYASNEAAMTFIKARAREEV